MDEPDVDPVQLDSSLRFLRRINRLLGYTGATLSHLRRFSRGWKPGQRIDLLDLATGSADIPMAIVRWGRRAGFNLHITAIDLHERTISHAAQRVTDDRVRLVQADVMHPPFEPQSFDYCLTALFLHHLDDEQIVRVLRTMDRLCRRGMIIGDLLRNRRAYAWVSVMTLLSQPIIRHDAKVSIGQAFTPGEILALRDQAGAGYLRLYRHFAHRFVLAGEKQAVAGIHP
jgi:ubiquinone/menaquinone biosynthesis C-methylase UbiE